MAAYICEIYAVKKALHDANRVRVCVRFARGELWEESSRVPPVRKSYSFVPTLVLAVFFHLRGTVLCKTHTLFLSQGFGFIIYERRSAGFVFENKSLPPWAHHSRRSIAASSKVGRNSLPGE